MEKKLPSWHSCETEVTSTPVWAFTVTANNGLSWVLANHWDQMRSELLDLINNHNKDTMSTPLDSPTLLSVLRCEAIKKTLL